MDLPYPSQHDAQLLNHLNRIDKQRQSIMLK
jgi:hypothetical protein